MSPGAPSTAFLICAPDLRETAAIPPKRCRNQPRDLRRGQRGRLPEQEAMKRFIGWAVSAGLVFAASAAHAQMLAPYRAVSDFDGPYERPYGAVPPAPPPVYDYGQYGGPSLLPPQEVYAILRDNGFSPLGVPTQRGLVYTVAVIDRNGEDGRLVIDARNGRIIRFTPRQGYGQGQGYGYGYGRGPYGPRPYDQ